MKTKNKTKEQLSKELTQIRKAFDEVNFNFKLLMENGPQKIFYKDKNSVYVFASKNFARDLKTTPDEMTGKTDFDFFPKELAEKYREDDQRIITEGNTEELEEKYIQDGQNVFVKTVKTPITDKKGHTVGILGHFWEVTEYKRSETHALKQNAVLNAINTVFKEALTCETEKDLGKRCLEVAEELTGSKFGFIGEVNPVGRFDTLAISNPGWDACMVPETNAVIMINDMVIRGIWGKVIKDGQSLITNEPASHPDRVGIPEGHPPLTTFLGVPLKDKDATFGMIALGNKDGGYDIADQEAAEALSVAIVVALQRRRTELKLAQQSQEILELSTPVIQVWEGVLIAPLIGMLDSERTFGFMERFLNSIVETRSSVAMVDITGVPTVDTQTAQHLIEAISAARLLGTKVVLTGVRPSIAQTLVHLGIDLSEIETRSSLSAGLRLALDLLNLEVVEQKRLSGDRG
jgi:PAS domain S-box-containing protein